MGARRLPASAPPDLNYAVVSGKAIGEPREGGGPDGTPVLVMEMEFPVAHPERPRLLWSTAAYEVEVPGDLGRGVEELTEGTPLLVAGRLTERWSLQDGRSKRRGAILASQIQAGASGDRT